MSGQVDKDEVIMLVRAVVAAKKHSITVRELAADYYECNASHIPFRQLGYPTLIDFLQSQPDKLTLVKTANEISVKAVVDSSIGQICRLVQGQKTASKKKKKAKTPKGLYYAGLKRNQIASNFNRFGNSNNNQYQGHSQYNGQRQYNNYNNFNNNYGQYRTAPGNYQNNQAQVSRPPLRPVSSNMPPQYNNNNSSNYNNNMSQFGESTKMSNRSLAMTNGRGSEHGSSSNLMAVRKDSLDSSSPQSPEDRWVNAAYYLREHPVIITHVPACDHVFLRLKGAQFSESYTELKNSMDLFYRTNLNNPSWKQAALTHDAICVASDKSKTSFYRVQIIRKEADDLYSCIFLDEGVTRNLRSSSLFKMQEPFMHLKFQAVRVYLPYFSSFGDNLFLKERLSQLLLGRELTAKRVSKDPLTAGLFSGDTCLTENFFHEHRHFSLFKPTPGTAFATMLTYIDSDSALSYVEVPNDSREKFIEMMEEVNDYYNDSDSAAEQASFKKEFNLERDANSLICCARYAVDNIWYRVKVLRLCPGEKFMAHFIDFGNREPISVNEFRLIPENMREFKCMPPQALPVSIISNDSFKTEDLRKVYSSCTLFVRVTLINSAGLPSVEILRAHENPPQPLALQEPQSNQISEQLAIKMNDLAKTMSLMKMQNSPRCPEEEKGLDEPDKSVKYEKLTTPDLPSGTNVYVTYVNNPFDFVINLEVFRTKFNELKAEMKEFYSQRKADFVVKELEKDGIYVYCDSDNECHRVKFIDVVAVSRARVQDMDNGYYEAPQKSELFHITRRFMELPPLAIKCRMTNLSCDGYGTWSERANETFKQLTKDKTFRATILSYDCRVEYFKIELNNLKGPADTVSSQLVKALAK